MQSVHKLEDEQVAEYKEVFMLFDKDMDGVLSFAELGIAMKALGQRPSGNQKLLSENDAQREKKVSWLSFAINNLFFSKRKSC